MEQTTLIDAEEAERRSESRFGRVSEADELDRYWTPSWAVQLLLSELHPDVWTEPVAEPCAGDGAIMKALEPFETLAGDVDPDSPYPSVDARSDAALDYYAECNCVITNPPYSCDAGTAFEIVDNLLALEVPMAALLRLSWMEPCSDRAALFDDPDRRPHRIIVPPRIHFEGPGGGDNNPQASAWWIWRPDSERTWPRVEWRTEEDRDRVEGQEALV